MNEFNSPQDENSSVYAYKMSHVAGHSNTDSYVAIGRKLSAVNYSFLHIRSSRMEPDFENGFQMRTRHIIMIAVSFFPIRKDAQVPRTSD